MLKFRSLPFYSLILDGPYKMARGGIGSGGGGGSIESLFSTNRGRAIILSFLLFIPIISYKDNILFAFSQQQQQQQPPPPNNNNVPSDNNNKAQDAFNSYKLNTPLFEAVKSNDLELTRSLLSGGVVSTDNNNDSSANNNNNDKSKSLGKVTFYNVNAEDPKGITPLIEATLLGNIELVELLLLHGAKAQPSPGFRHTPLRAACLTGNVTLIKLLLDEGADPNAKSEGGRTPLMGACYLRPTFDEKPERVDISYEAVMAMLEDTRTDPTIKNEVGEDAITLCRERGYTKSQPVLRSRMQQLGISL